MMKEVNLRKVAQSQGEYDLPEVEERFAESQVVGKMCFDDRSRFVEASGKEFESKVEEILSKRYPQGRILTSMIDGDMKCVTYVVKAISKKDVQKVSSLKELGKRGFRDLGGGVYRKGNQLWSLKVDGGGNHSVIRSEAESEFGTNLEEQEVIVSQKVKGGEVEALSKKEVGELGYVVDELSGKIVNSERDNVGRLLFIIE